MNDHWTHRFAAFPLVAVVAISCLRAAAAADLTHLRCDYLADPLGIDVAKPRLSWVIEGGGQKTEDRGQKQTAYQVLVASTPELLAKDQGDLWDSGQVASDQSIQVEYAGQPLLSRTRRHWKVRVWDSVGHRSAWSQPALWTMGLLKHSDWTAKMIAANWPGPTNMPLPWFRKTFLRDAKPKRATAFVCALGYYELYVNGDLKFARTKYRSIRGDIVSNWQREADKLSMDIIIPANTTATVFVPEKDAASVTESDKPANPAEGVKFLRMENNAAVYAVGSGTYRLQSMFSETVK